MTMTRSRIPDNLQPGACDALPADWYSFKSFVVASVQPAVSRKRAHEVDSGMLTRDGASPSRAKD